MVTKLEIAIKFPAIEPSPIRCPNCEAYPVHEALDLTTNKVFFWCEICDDYGYIPEEIINE